MKKILLLSLSTIILWLGFIQNVSALDFDPETHKYTENPEIPEEEIQRIKLIAEQEERKRFMQRGGESKRLSVPYESQNTNYNCGPASVRMVSLYLGYANKGWTQSVISSSIGTERLKQSDIGMVTQGLKWYADNNYYYSRVGLQGIFGATYGSINANRPVVANVWGSKLNPAFGSDVQGHFVVITGYLWYAVGSTSTTTLTYIDPWSGRVGQPTDPRTVTEAQFTDAMTIYGRLGYYARR